jgi:hypothetical protein
MQILILTKENGSQVRIVESEKAMTETLFKPIDGKHTADGYLLPALKRCQRFMVGSKLYAVNTHGVLIKGSPIPDSKKVWWQCQLEFAYRAGREAIDQLAKGRDKIGWYFK